MEINRGEALEKAGWTSGDAADFLGLGKEDRELPELRPKVSRESPPPRDRRDNGI